MTDSIARNIVSQLGDLYMGFAHPATTDRADFVKYRQTTNDQAAAFVEALLREYGAALLEALCADLQKDYDERAAPHPRRRRTSYLEGWLDGHDAAGSRLLDHLKAIKPEGTPAQPPTHHEALAASGGLLNAPEGDGCDHRWRTFQDRRDGLYGCCVRCAQRCLACARGLNGSGPGRITVCGTCGTDWRGVEVPRT